VVLLAEWFHIPPKDQKKLTVLGEFARFVRAADRRLAELASRGR
jgi:hypothetical protein